MKQKSLNKVLAFVLTLAMLLGSFAVTAFGSDPVSITPKSALDGVTTYYKTQQKAVLTDWWELLAVYTAGEDLTDYVLPKTAIITDNSMPSDYTGVFITELIKGNSLSKKQAQKLASKQDLTTGSFGYEMSNQQAWAMIALDLYNRNADEADKVPYDVTKAIEYLLTFQINGNFYYSSQYPYPGVDYTGAVAIALAPYLNTDQWPDTLDSENLINNALKYDKTEYGSYGNAGTAAFAIYGYNALGVNSDHLDYINAINELIAYQVGDGGFYNPYGEDNSSNSYYTKQAAVALAETVKGKSAFMDLTKNTMQYLSVDISVQINGSIIKKTITIPSTTTVGDAVAQAVPLDTDLSDYKYYTDSTIKAPDDTLNYEDSIIAIPPNITYISSISANKTEINIGENMMLTLSAVNLSTGQSADSVSGASIVINGRAEDAIKLDDTGEYTFSPTESGEYNFSVVWPDGVDSYSAAIYTVRVKGVDQAIPVSVRVEGLDGNILYNKSLTVTGSESLLTVYDAITQALNKGGVPFEASSEGLFKSINGIANDTTYQTSVYWMYTINEEQYLNGSKWVSPTTLIKENDEIIVYCGSSATYPFVQSELMENGDVKITFTSYQYVNQNNNWDIVLKEISGADIVWALGTDNECREKTDDNGIVTIPSEKAAVGSYTLQIEKLDANGIPEVIRLAPGFEVTVKEGGTSSTVPSTPGESVPKVSISVIGPDKNTLLSKTDYTYSSRMTALSLLRSTGLSLTYNDSSKTYVSSIEGYTEFDHGPTSGWLFKVNGNEFILSSADAYKLEPGDNVVWFYTKDYTKETGSSKWNGTQLPKEVTGSLTKDTLNAIMKEVRNSKRDSWTVNLEHGDITFDKDALAGLVDQMNGDSVDITIIPAAGKDLSAKQRETVGDRPIYNISVISGNKSISNFKGKLTISLPYKLKEGELASGIVVYYLDSDGNIVEQKTTYNAATGNVTFVVDHLSYYLIGYDQNRAAWPFNDVTPANWHYNSVKYVYEQGLFSGTSSTTFKPDESFTRAMLVSVLARLSKADLSTYTTSQFGDVDIDTWYGPSVAWAKETGVVSGYLSKDGKATFRPDQKISRQDMALMINNYAEKIVKKSIEGTQDVKTFKDRDQIAGYAAEAVAVMQKAGIINGVKNSDGSFSFLPAENATRAQAAQMIAVYHQKYEQ